MNYSYYVFFVLSIYTSSTHAMWNMIQTYFKEDYNHHQQSATKKQREFRILYDRIYRMYVEQACHPILTYQKKEKS